MKTLHLADLLEFGGQSDSIDRLVEDHLGRVTRLLVTAISIGIQGGGHWGERLRALVKGLGAAEIGRIVTSPRIFGELTAICVGDAERIEDLVRVLESDSRVRSGRATEPGDWTIDCEMGIEAVGGGRQVAVQRRIHECIVVDLRSDWTRTAQEYRSGVFNLPSSTFGEKEESVVVEKISSAMDIIDEQVPSAARLIRNFTRVIRVRLREGDDFGSEQVPRELGAIRLLNPHLRSVSILDLCDYLLHESVHNCLSAYENAYGAFVADDHVHSRYRPVSPWSGRPIPLQSFCHAVYVYYALFSLFSKFRPIGGTEIDPEDVQKKVIASARGFMFPPRLGEYLRAFGVADQLLTEFNRIQGLVRDCLFRRIAGSVPL